MPKSPRAQLPRESCTDTFAFFLCSSQFSANSGNCGEICRIFRWAQSFRVLLWGSLSVASSDVRSFKCAIEFYARAFGQEQSSNHCYSIRDDESRRPSSLAVSSFTRIRHLARPWRTALREHVPQVHPRLFSGISTKDPQRWEKFQEECYINPIASRSLQSESSRPTTLPSQRKYRKLGGKLIFILGDPRTWRLISRHVELSKSRSETVFNVLRNARLTQPSLRKLRSVRKIREWQTPRRYKLGDSPCYLISSIMEVEASTTARELASSRSGTFRLSERQWHYKTAMWNRLVSALSCQPRVYFGWSLKNPIKEVVQREWLYRSFND